MFYRWLATSVHLVSHFLSQRGKGQSISGCTPRRSRSLCVVFFSGQKHGPRVFRLDPAWKTGNPSTHGFQWPFPVGCWHLSMPLAAPRRCFQDVGKEGTSKSKTCPGWHLYLVNTCNNLVMLDHGSTFLSMTYIAHCGLYGPVVTAQKGGLGWRV